MTTLFKIPTDPRPEAIWVMCNDPRLFKSALRKAEELELPFGELSVPIFLTGGAVALANPDTMSEDCNVITRNISTHANAHHGRNIRRLILVTHHDCKFCEAHYGARYEAMAQSDLRKASIRMGKEFPKLLISRFYVRLNLRKDHARYEDFAEVDVEAQKLPCPIEFAQ